MTSYRKLYLLDVSRGVPRSRIPAGPVLAHIERLGSNPDALERRLRRYGRADLWRALSQAVDEVAS